MSSYNYEERLKEVTYLHTLWHQGPPNRNPNNPPQPLFRNYPVRNLHVHNPVPFKRQARKNTNIAGSNPGKECPVNPPPTQPPSTSSGWPQMSISAGPLTRPDQSPDMQCSVKMQKKVAVTCREFFATRVDTESEESEGEEEGEIRDGNGDGVVEESEEYKFFLDLFVKNVELREYYERNYEKKGDFMCLVCCAMGRKMNEKFYCTGLVSHAINPSRTKRKKGHKAFGHVICRVVGWTTKSLPLFLLNEKPLGLSLVKSGDTKVEMDVVDTNKDNVNVGENIVGCENVNVGENIVGCENVNNSGCESIPFEVEMDVVDTNKDNVNVVENNVGRENVNNSGCESIPFEISSTLADDRIKDPSGSICETLADDRFKDVEVDKEDGLHSSGSDAILACNMQWPCKEPIHSSAMSWPAFETKRCIPSSVDPIPDMQSTVMVQKKAAESCREFFISKFYSESEGNAADDNGEIDEIGDDFSSESDDDDDVVVEESEVYKFLLELFVNNVELREYYEKSNVKGDFRCLVCYGMGENMNKKLQDCEGLVRHAMDISKTKKIKAHRAFAHVICRIVGWDITRFPHFVLAEKPLSSSLENSSGTQGPDTLLGGGVEWPCKEPIHASTTASWPAFQTTNSIPSPADSTPDVDISVLMQKKVAESCREFFNAQVDSVSEVSRDSDNGGEFDKIGDEDFLPQDDDDDVVVEESEEYKFLLELFAKNVELREYYKKSYEKGDFRCLVCYGIGENMNKKLKDCEGLVRHAMDISKTKKIKAHRAFAHVICRVVGWDIKRFPQFVLLEKPLSSSLENSGGTQSLLSDIDGSRTARPSLATKLKMQKLIKRMLYTARFRNHCDTEWPCKESVHASTTTSWPAFETQKCRPSQPNLIPDMQSTVQMQKKVAESCREFFVTSADWESEGSEKDQDEGINEISDEDFEALEDNDDDVVVEDSEVYKFLLDLFVKNIELKEFYEKNYEKGDFRCLVCYGMGENMNKKLKDCKGLVLHALETSKTKNIKAHRAFGHVICKVIGWDIETLPLFVLTEEPLVPLNCNETQDSEVLLACGTQWPCLEPVHDSDAKTWPAFKAQKVSETSAVSSSEEPVILTGVQLQKKAAESCHEFFTTTVDSDSEGSEDDENGELDGIEGKEVLTGDDVVEQKEEYKFLLDLFVKNVGLREYYEKNFEKGDFRCLVCYAMGENMNKKLKDCEGLVLHAMNTSKTKKIKAHRAFGHVICKVVGWDIEKLPLFALTAEPLSHSLANSIDTLGTTVIKKVSDDLVCEST